MDKLQKQKLLEQLMEKPGITNQLPTESEYVQKIMALDTLANPERGYEPLQEEGIFIKPYVQPFEGSGLDPELEKYSQQYYKKGSAALTKQQLLNLLMNLDEAKKSVGLKQDIMF